MSAGKTLTGSLQACLDPSHLLKTGPESSGANPGPKAKKFSPERSFRQKPETDAVAGTFMQSCAGKKDAAGSLCCLELKK